MDLNYSNALEVLNQFMYAYLTERNAEKALSYVTDTVHSIGTGCLEIALNKKELSNLMKNEIQNDPLPFQFRLIQKQAKKLTDSVVSAYCTVLVSKELSDKDSFTIQARMSVVLCNINGIYKISDVHLSTASDLQEEDEFYPFQFGEKTIYKIKQEIQKNSLELLNSSIPGGIMGGYIEPGFPVYMVNKHILSHLGYTYDEFIKDIDGYIINCIHPDDRDYVNKVVADSFLTSDEYKVNYRMLKKDKSFIWVFDKGKKITAEDGRAAIISVCTDITESILLQKELSEKAAMLTATNKVLTELADNIPNGFIKCAFNPKMEFTFLSDGFTDLFGYTQTEIKTIFDNSFYNIIYYKDTDKIRTQIETLISNEIPVHLEYRIQTKKGNLIWINSKGEIAHNEDGKYFYAVLIDITEIKTKDAAIKTLTENIPGGVCEVLLDDTFTLLYANEAFYHLYGYTPLQMKEELSNQLISLVHPDDVKQIRALLDNAFKKKQKNIEYEKRAFKKDHSLIWTLTRCTFSENQYGTVLNCVVIDITKRKKIEQELKVSEERFRIALSQTSNVIFDYNIASKTIIRPQKSQTVLPDKVENVPNSLVERGIMEQECAEKFSQMHLQIKSGVPSAFCIVKTKQNDTTFLWNKITLTIISYENGKPARAIGISEDITRQKETELAYKKEEQYRNALLSDALYYYEINITQDKIDKNNNLILLNSVDVPIPSYSSLLKILLQNFIHPDDKQNFYNLFALSHIIHTFHMGKTELKLEHKQLNENKEYSWTLTTMHLLEDTVTKELKGFIYVKDIDTQKKDTLNLEYKSQRDCLTKLYNKGTTEFLIKTALTTAKKNFTQAFFIVDLDHFKTINDTHGHIFGDSVLAQTAQKIKSIFTNEDIIGRIGGDEFVIFVKDIKKLNTIDEKAQELCTLLNTMPLDNPNTSFTISCSIGISLSPTDGFTFETLYKKADIALYTAKKQGRNQFAYYNGDLEDCQWNQYTISTIDSQ